MVTFICSPSALSKLGGKLGAGTKPQESPKVNWPCLYFKVYLAVKTKYTLKKHLPIDL